MCIQYLISCLRSGAFSEYISCVVHSGFFFWHKSYLMHLDNFQFQFLEVEQKLRQLLSNRNTNLFPLFFFFFAILSRDSFRFLLLLTFFTVNSLHQIQQFVTPLLPVLCKEVSLVLTELITFRQYLTKFCNSSLSGNNGLGTSPPRSRSVWNLPPPAPELTCLASASVFIGRMEELFNLSKSIKGWPIKRGSVTLWACKTSWNLELLVCFCGSSLPGSVIRNKGCQGICVLAQMSFSIHLPSSHPLAC